LPWSNAVHYADEPGRRAAFEAAIADGMPPGYGVGDAAALHFVGTELSEVVSSRPAACALYVSADSSGEVQQRKLAVRYLGARAPAVLSGAVAA
jgi:hypothetical protein